MPTDYGTRVESFLRTDDTTSASDSDAHPPVAKYKSSDASRSYRLWSHEIKEPKMTVHNAIDSLGESYTSGTRSRLEFENRTQLITNFSNYKSPDSPNLPFIVEEGGSPSDYGLLHHLRDRCWYSSVRATRTMCWVCTECFSSCYRRL